MYLSTPRGCRRLIVAVVGFSAVESSRAGNSFNWKGNLAERSVLWSLIKP